MSTRSKSPKVSVRDIVLIGMMIATIEVAKQALVALPNVELVSFLIILYTQFFGKRIFYVIPAFILIEAVIHGFGIWVVMYVYIWPLLAILTLVFKKRTEVWFWSLLSGFFGLFFGTLCTIPYIFIMGPAGAFGWWVAGIPYDIVHAVSNFILCFVLLKPLTNTMKKLETAKWI